MAILSSETFAKHYKAELVNKDHILKTYMIQTPKSVSSCMAGESYTKFYSFVEGLSLLRIRKGSHLKARALIWETRNAERKAIKFFDRLYSVVKNDYDNQSVCDHYAYWDNKWAWQHNYANYCKICKPEEEMNLVYDWMMANWPKYADVRSSKQKLLTRVKPSYKRSKLLKDFNSDCVYFDTFYPIETESDHPTIFAMSNSEFDYEEAKELVKSIWV